MRIPGNSFDVQSIHRSLETNMEFVDFPLRQSNDGDTLKGKTLEQCCDVRLVSRNAIQRLSQYNIERSRLRIAQESLNARP
ncbi:hypothetical protein GOX01_20700 [Gluconobacter oxydans]|nr:hypothetical protein GOX01_20700 [Gluconobacter oxydans]